MKIQKLTIDKKELCEAVQAYLKTKGIDLPVTSVSKRYTWETESEVSFEEDIPAPKEPIDTTPEPPVCAEPPSTQPTTPERIKETPEPL